MIALLRLFQKKRFVLSSEHENQNLATICTLLDQFMLKGPSQPYCTARVSSETGHFQCHRYSETFTVVVRSHCIGASSLLSSEYLLLRVCWTIIEDICRYIFLTVIIFHRFLRIGGLSNRRSILSLSWEVSCWMNSWKQGKTNLANSPHNKNSSKSCKLWYENKPQWNNRDQNKHVFS